MTEDISLPDGWKLKSVDELYHVMGGGTPSTAVSEFWSGDIPWITSADIHGLKDIRPRKKITEDAISNSATNLVPAGSLIVVTRVSLGKVALANFPLCFSQDSQSLIARDNSVLPEYALYYLSQSVQIFKYQGRGTTISGVTKKQLKDLPIPLPPLPEQERIVAKIEELFTQLDVGVAGLRRVQAALKRYKASVLKAACEGRLVEQDPNDEPAEKVLKRILTERGELFFPPNGELGELPFGWCWAHLPDIGILARGKSKHRPRNASFLYGGPYPFVQTGDIRQANGIINQYSQTYSEAGLKQSKLWKKGTLCITIAANIAETAILGFDACFPDSVVGFVPTLGLEIKYVQYFISTVKDDLERYAPATAQKNINLNTLQKLVVPIPPPLEQRLIVAEVERRLSVVQELEQTVEASLKRAGRLRQAILKRAFEGRLV